MPTRRFVRIILAASLLFTVVTTARKAGGANGADKSKFKNGRFIGERKDTKLYDKKHPQQGTSLSASVLIVVNGRTLTGPNSSAQQRGGRLFLPVASIAHALGDVIESDATSRVVTVRRQDGIVADFSAQLNQVRENGSVSLAISTSVDIVFPPDVQELMLPAEIVAALLNASIRREERNAINVTRGKGQVSTVHDGEKHAPWELFQIEYDYNFSRYTSFSDHNLTLRGSGRLGDSRFTFLTNSNGGPSHVTGFQGGNLRLERPSGQNFVLGDFGTGTDLQFMSATVRGGWAELPVGSVRLHFLGGRSVSGLLRPVQLLVPAPFGQDPPEQIAPRIAKFHYDTNIFGAYVTAGSLTNGPNQRELLFSSGVMHFSGPDHRGDMLAGSVRYAAGRSRFQADVGAGEFSGLSRDNARVKGLGVAFSLSGSVQLTDQLIVQGRYTYVGRTFLSSQRGLQDPIKLAAAGVSWQPRQWLTASLSGSTAATPGKVGDFNQFVTASINVTPGGRWPSLFASHTQNSSPQLKNAAFTLLTAVKQFSRWQLFVNATRVKTFGPAAFSTQAGASIRINESNALDVSQAIGTQGLLSGTAAWQVSRLFDNHFNFSGGVGYMRSGNSTLRMTEQGSVSLRLPRQSFLQFSYMQSQTGPTLLLSFRGLLLSPRRAERALNGPVAEVNSYSALYGRVYQDMNLNGLFDPGIDTPQANVKVRVDGNRYVVTGPDGNYRIDSVQRGNHAIYLDLLSVRADLTLLDGAQQDVALVSARDSVVDFRLVRTGRIGGVVWLDINENGKFDEDEQPLADVRIVTGSGRDTLTDGNGHYVIGDLPPGEHIILVDEKTLPDQVRSIRGSLSVMVLVGKETSDIVFPVTAIPAEVKQFPSN